MTAQYSDSEERAMSEKTNTRQTNRAQARRSAQREERAATARKHTSEMAAQFDKEIARTLAELRQYDGVPDNMPTHEASQAPAAIPQITIVDQDSVTAVLEHGRGRADMCDLAVLDFASFTHPGGGYDRGTMAQEESLCAESFLYNCLTACKDWYAENRRHNINCELYRERALVLPKVRFERERYHSYADVIVAAAPNARRARADYKVADKDLNAAMRRRIHLVLNIADELGHNKLILGAFGCGVFGWNATTVARMFVEELATGAHVAQEIIFAIPQGRYDDNLARFQHAFAKFPEVNDEAYTPAPSRAKADRVQQNAAEKNDTDSQDESEEDWRKYL